LNRLLAPSRQTFVTNAIPSEALNRIGKICDGVLLQNRDPDMVPPVLAYALEQQAEASIQGFYTQNERYLQESLKERPNVLFIGNQNLMRDTTDLSNVPDWVHTQMARHPSDMTRGIGFVNFAVGFDEESVADDSIEWSKLGTTNNAENTITINIGNHRIAPSLKEVSDPDDDFIKSVQELYRAKITSTLDHELTHYAHHHRIPIEWLEEWQATIETEPVNVTNYVDDMRSPNPSNPGDADCEDLCDSTSMYLNEPWTLLKKAPRRFALLNARDGRYPEAMLDQARTVARTLGDGVSSKGMDIILSSSADRNRSQAPAVGDNEEQIHE
jgi:hypothetical protein